MHKKAEIVATLQWPDTFPGLEICYKCFCGRGSVPDPLGELTASPRVPRLPSWISGSLLLRGGRESGGRRGERRERGSRGEEESKGKGREWLPPPRKKEKLDPPMGLTAENVHLALRGFRAARCTCVITWRIRAWRSRVTERNVPDEWRNVEVHFIPSRLISSHPRRHAC